MALCRIVRYVSSSLIGGCRLCNTLLSTTVLKNDVCIAWCKAFLVLANNGNTCCLCLVMSAPSFPLLDDPQW